MTVCDVAKIVGGALFLAFGAAWIYGLRSIVPDVNQTRPERQQIRWKSYSQVEGSQWRVHRAWEDHIRLFPNSRKRLYAGISLISAFAFFIAAISACLFFAGTI